MNTNPASDAAKAVVLRNTREVQGGGNFDLFEELFADDFVDHTPQPNTTPDKAGVRKLYGYIRAAFPDFHAEIHWQLADGECVTTYKTYHGTHEVTGRSQTIGVWAISCPSWSRSAGGLRQLTHKRWRSAAFESEPLKSK